MKFALRVAHTASGLVVAVVASLALAPAPAAAQAFVQPAPIEGVLGVQASASVEVARDVLVVTFQAAREGSDANAVQAELKRALDAALQIAKAAARPGALDVRTGNFALSPRYAQPPAGSARAPAIDGWVGSAELVVEGRDLAAIGELTGRIRTMTIASVAQRLSREASGRVEDEVVAAAIAAFRAKAASYTRQFGYAAWTVREVNVQTDEQGGPQPLVRMRVQAAAVAEALPVEAGKATVRATVSGTIQMTNAAK